MNHAERAHPIFNTAKNHIAGAQLIMQSDGIRNLGLPALPVVVLSALSIELLLKTIHCLENGAAPRGHDNYELFSSVGESARNKVLDIYRNKTGFSPDETLTWLRRERDAFTKWRYVFELEEAQTAPLPHFEFAVSLHDYLLSVHPEW